MPDLVAITNKNNHLHNDVSDNSDNSDNSNNSAISAIYAKFYRFLNFRNFRMFRTFAFSPFLVILSRWPSGLFQDPPLERFVICAKT